MVEASAQRRTDRAEGTLRHVLSHQVLEARFHSVWLEQPQSKQPTDRPDRVYRSADADLPKPVLIKLISLTKCGNKN
jgi:A/G-specific adenine glycosylase